MRVPTRTLKPPPKPLLLANDILEEGLEFRSSASFRRVALILQSLLWTALLFGIWRVDIAMLVCLPAIFLCRRALRSLNPVGVYIRYRYRNRCGPRGSRTLPLVYCLEQARLCKSALALSSDLRERDLDIQVRGRLNSLLWLECYIRARPGSIKGAFGGWASAAAILPPRPRRSFVVFNDALPECSSRGLRRVLRLRDYAGKPEC